MKCLTEEVEDDVPVGSALLPEAGQKCAELASIEPEAVLGAAVDHDRPGLTHRQLQFAHALRTPWTAALALTDSRRVTVEVADVERAPRLLTQQLQLTVVEPEAATGDTPVELDLLALDDDKWALAGGTLHSHTELYVAWVPIIRPHADRMSSMMRRWCW